MIALIFRDSEFVDYGVLGKYMKECGYFETKDTTKRGRIWSAVQKKYNNEMAVPSLQRSVAQVSGK